MVCSHFCARAGHCWPASCSDGLQEACHEAGGRWTCPMAPGFTSLGVVEEKQGFRCTEPEASLWKILPVMRCVQFEVEDSVLIDALSKRKFRNTYIQGCSIYTDKRTGYCWWELREVKLIRNLVFSGYKPLAVLHTASVSVCKEPCFNASQLLIIVMTLARGETTLSSYSLLCKIIISYKESNKVCRQNLGGKNYFRGMSGSKLIRILCIL